MKFKAGWIVIFLVLGLALIGCSGENVGTSESEDNETSVGDNGLSGRVLVWVHPYADPQLMNPVWEEMKNTFEEQHPNVEIVIEEIPWQNREQKLLTALAANQGPDVFYLLPDQTPLFAQQGILEPISKYVDEAFMSEFNEASLNAARYQGELYGLTILGTVVSPYYNLDIVKEIGEDPNNLPATWDEFKEWAQKAKEKGYYAFTFRVADGAVNMGFYPWIWQAGGDIIDDNGNVIVTEPEAMEALHFINTAFQEGWIHPDVSQDAQNEAFLNGQVMVNFTSNIFIANQEAGIDKVDFEWTVGPLLENKRKATYSAVGMFAVPSNSDNKDAAVEFVKFMTNEDNQRLFNKATSYIPSRPAAADIYDGHQLMEIVVEQSEFTLPGVKDPVGRLIIPHVTAAIQSMLNGDFTPEEAAEHIAKKIEEERANIQ
ncbi:multiple sugar transport system substrate-binding protein [Caldalkalibacillus uzonensis]|uniref:Multiple sugar transport system substrate-binding protein n=1 Tax=Caldalkalibacillus uzonensis TaxID=353224 RepID=A0ABU0CQ87_9BACI|nr:ABC transporter substrate-binding protein [Caldalkalibacillus uzonensis]MDQ0338572.1 multiple sugar transport system substrate-binding protein [Caldalkalibacillus uzonensis]